MTISEHKSSLRELKYYIFSSRIIVSVSITACCPIFWRCVFYQTLRMLRISLLDKPAKFGPNVSGKTILTGLVTHNI